MEWDNVPTTGTPPTGTIGYSSACINDDLYVFGGTCNYICYHDELHCLNTANKIWSIIPTTAAITGPMKKCDCGLIPYSYQGSDYLLTLGGNGGRQRPTQQQQHSLYMHDDRGYYTNEVHTMNITTSPGMIIIIIMLLLLLLLL